MKPVLLRLVLLFSLFSFMQFASAQQSQLFYLSGKGVDAPVVWNFNCSGGRFANRDTLIQVPSVWEQHGFGSYHYGQDPDSVRETIKGIYTRKFFVPMNWKGKAIDLVFEGVMTDALVKINGKKIGPVHQGAFYRFSYTVDRFLDYGKENQIEVIVTDNSSDESVNQAERHGDFWIFGGIFRPVYLKINPREHISQTAIDARADGHINLKILIDGVKKGCEIETSLYTTEGRQIGTSFIKKIPEDSSGIFYSYTYDSVQEWSAETPVLYNLRLRLLNKGKVIHELSQKIGFRTIEVRSRDGIYLNGKKIRLKGVNHHVFRPEYGRASCRAFSLEDVKLIRSMNMNAVRCSHYPPDRHFIEVCDSLGLYVLDELTGWHHAYSTKAGSILAREMVRRDRNSPSVIFWDNGNEGGTNPELDTVIRSEDLQKRAILYPWQIHDGITTEHYRDYDYGAGAYWNGKNIVLPTEFLHGLYDGGAGAGLKDYWNYILAHPRAAGGFIWDFADEGISRTDRDGAIDTDGSHAPDGILGPHFEREGSYYTIRKIFSPVVIEDKDLTGFFNGNLVVTNRYAFTNLNQCQFYWTLNRFPISNHSDTIRYSGETEAPNIEPGERGFLQLNLPDNWRSYDVLYLTVKDPHGQTIYTWSFSLTRPVNFCKQLITIHGNEKVVANRKDSLLEVKADQFHFSFSLKNGCLRTVENKQGLVPFSDGPIIADGKTFVDSVAFVNYGDSLLIHVSYKKESAMKDLYWIVYQSGWIALRLFDVPAVLDKDFPFMGINFSYPEDSIIGVNYLGAGPYRVWKNREDGVELGLWHKKYNDTKTGISPYNYPEFKGYYSDFFAVRIFGKRQSFLIACASENSYLRLFTPSWPEKVWNTAPPFPKGDISIMQAIPAIGTKNQKAEDMGPSGHLNQFFDYGPYDSWQKRSKQLNLYFWFASSPFLQN